MMRTEETTIKEIEELVGKLDIENLSDEEFLERMIKELR